MVDNAIKHVMSDIMALNPGAFGRPPGKQNNECFPASNAGFRWSRDILAGKICHHHDLGVTIATTMRINETSSESCALNRRHPKSYGSTVFNSLAPCPKMMAHQLYLLEPDVTPGPMCVIYSASVVA